MDRHQLTQVRRDLDILFPEGGYELIGNKDEPAQLLFDDSVHENVRRFAEETLRLHGVRFRPMAGRKIWQGLLRLSARRCLILPADAVVPAQNTHSRLLLGAAPSLGDRNERCGDGAAVGKRSSAADAFEQPDQLGKRAPLSIGIPS